MPPELITRVVDGFTEDELRRARSALSLPEDASKTKVAQTLENYCAAALVEYLDQFLGRALPTRYRDLQMLRLLHISLHANGGRLLAPDRVSDLFQLTHAEAKTLVRNTATRYRFEFEGKLMQVAWETLVASGKQDGHGYKIEVRDAALLEFLHDLVRRGPGYPIGIQASQEMHVFSLDAQTMSALLAGLGHSKAELDETLAEA